MSVMEEYSVFSLSCVLALNHNFDHVRSDQTKTGFNTSLLSCIDVPLHRQVRSTLHQALGNEGVVHRYDQQGNDVENEKGGHGVDLRVQIPGMGIWGTGDKAFICGSDVKGVEVGEDGLWDSQDQGEDPDERRPQDNGGSGARCLDVQRLHNGPVSDR